MEAVSPMLSLGLTRDQHRGCKKNDKDHMEFLCELYDAQVARGRCFVHELTPEVNSRMQCVAKILAMPGTRSTVADLCTFGLAARNRREPGFVNASARTPTRDKLERGCKVNAQARIGTLVLTRRTTQSGKWYMQEHGYIKLPEQWRNSWERISRS